jgi:DNA repair exonuclease SbcCD ATPase subunit
MNKKQLKKQIEELKDELNEAVAHHNNHARLLAEAREEIAKLEQEKLDMCGLSVCCPVLSSPSPMPTGSTGIGRMRSSQR